MKKKMTTTPPATSYGQIIHKLENKVKRLSKVIVTLDEKLHSLREHPEYEYETTFCGRKCGSHEEPEGNGWKLNDDYNEGWERFDYHEETYWRRKK